MWAALLEKGIAKLLGSYKAANADVQISFGIELIRRSGFGASTCTAFVFSFLDVWFTDVVRIWMEVFRQLLSQC